MAERKVLRPRSHENPATLRVELPTVQSAQSLLQFIKARVRVLQRQVNFLADEVEDNDWKSAITDWKSGDFNTFGDQLGEFGDQLLKLAKKLQADYDSIKAEIGNDRFLQLVEDTIETAASIDQIKARWTVAGNRIAAFQLALAATAPRFADLPVPETQVPETRTMALEPFQPLAQHEHDLFLEID